MTASSIVPGRAALVNYHYIQPPADGPFGRMNGIGIAEFALQVQTMRRQMLPLCIEDLVRDGIIVGDDRGPVGVAVTFDDATREVFEHAIPLLREAGIKATIYCCSQPIAEGRLLDVQKIHILTRRLGFQRFRAAFDEAIESLFGPDVVLEPLPSALEPVYRYDDEETRGFKTRLNMQLPIRYVSETLSVLFGRFIGDERDAVRHVYMSMDDIARARDLGFSIGVHTHSHRMLSRLDARAQRDEILAPLDVFREYLDPAGPTMSYPYGIRGSWNDTTLQCVREAGIETCVTLTRMTYRPKIHKNRHEIPRFDVNDVFVDGGRLRTEILAA